MSLLLQLLSVVSFSTLAELTFVISHIADFYSQLCQFCW